MQWINWECEWETREKEREREREREREKEREREGKKRDKFVSGLTCKQMYAWPVESLSLSLSRFVSGFCCCFCFSVISDPEDGNCLFPVTVDDVKQRIRRGKYSPFLSTSTVRVRKIILIVMRDVLHASIREERMAFVIDILSFSGNFLFVDLPKHHLLMNSFLSFFHSNVISCLFSLAFYNNAFAESTLMNLNILEKNGVSCLQSGER